MLFKEQTITTNLITIDSHTREKRKSGKIKFLRMDSSIKTSFKKCTFQYNYNIDLPNCMSLFKVKPKNNRISKNIGEVSKYTENKNIFI